MPKRSIKSLKLDSKVEIILDERPFDNDVSIETFFSNCVVSCGEKVYQGRWFHFRGIKISVECKTLIKS